MAAASPVKATPYRIIESLLKMQAVVESEGELRSHKLQGGDALGSTYLALMASGLAMDFGMPEPGTEAQEAIWKPFSYDPNGLTLLTYREKPEVRKAIAFLALDIKTRYCYVLGDTRILMQILDPKRYDAETAKKAEELLKIMVPPPPGQPDSSRLLGVETKLTFDVLHNVLLPYLIPSDIEYDAVPPEFRPVVENMIDDAQMQKVYNDALKIKIEQFTAERLSDPEGTARKYLKAQAIEFVLKNEGPTENKYHAALKNLLIAYEEYLAPKPETPEDKPVYSAITSGSSRSPFTPEEERFLDEFGDYYEGFDEDEGEFEHPEELFTMPGLNRLRSGEKILFNGTEVYIPGLIDRAWDRTSKKQIDEKHLGDIRYAGPVVTASSTH